MSAGTEDKIDLRIVRDASGICVGAIMKGEIVAIDLVSKTLILRNGHDERVLAISEFMIWDTMITEYISSGDLQRYVPWEELKPGDWLDNVSVFINAARTEVRHIFISN